MPQDIVEESYDAEAAEVAPEENDDTTQYPDEPISDLDQLMANNNKSL